VDLTVDLSGRSDRASALYRALLDAVRSGRLRAGDRLPPTRALARDLGIARNTVATAYERLTAEGYLEARVGAGTFVSDVVTRPSGAGRKGVLRPRRSWQWEPSPVSGGQPVPRYDFRVGIPDAALFPFDSWRRMLASEWRLGGDTPGTYADPAGPLRLRGAIARYLAYSRGVTADPDDVIATQGTQQALDLIARVLLEPGDLVAVEDPGYPFARDVFALAGARVVPVPVDDEGLVVSRLPARTRLVFTTPSHQFPLGPPMSLARRQALLEYAATHDTAIIEDDYDSEFRFVERPLDTLHRLDAAGRVIYVGTFSKSLLPSLRAGYLVAPPSLRSALRAARQLADSHGSTPTQAALARFIEEGLLARHIRKAAKVYAARRALLTDAIGEHLGLRPIPSAAGLHLAVFLDDGIGIAARAAEEGIAVDSVASYTAGEGGRDGLVFGYGAVVTETIEPGLRRLARLSGRVS
jgi:GntR family transcriptional regulator/MocR family aminotransferase